ncbi:MAG: hypothetical protein ACM4AI_00640 [Acidobacteriota bacterium]
MTSAPAGIATSPPTAVNLPPSTRITWLALAVPVSGSISRPARIAVTWALRAGVKKSRATTGRWRSNIATAPERGSG